MRSIHGYNIPLYYVPHTDANPESLDLKTIFLVIFLVIAIIVIILGSIILVYLCYKKTHSKSQDLSCMLEKIANKATGNNI